MTLQEIYAAAEEKLALIDAIDALASAEEGREITDDEVERKQKLLDDHDALIKRGQQIETVEKAKADAAERNKPEVKAPTSPVTAEADARDESRFHTFGEQLQAIIRAAANPNTVDKRLLEMRAPTGMSEGVSSDGGYLVQTDFVTALLEKMHETGILAGRCWTLPVSAGSNGISLPAVDETSRADGSRLGGIRCYWTDEGKQKTSSKPKFRRVKMDLEKLTGICYLTDELMQDSAALGAFTTRGFGDEMGFKRDDAILNGTGAGQPLGINTGPCMITQAARSGQVAATVTYENIVDMWSRMWPRSRANSVWLINAEVEPQLDTMYLAVGTGGAPVYLPQGGVSTPGFSLLKGRPVIVCEQCQALGTAGDIILADFSQYLLIEKGGIDAATSIHLRFDYDETALRFVLRTNGMPTWNDTLTPFKGSNTLSPFVRLATRS